MSQLFNQYQTTIFSIYVKFIYHHSNHYCCFFTSYSSEDIRAITMKLGNVLYQTQNIPSFDLLAHNMFRCYLAKIVLVFSNYANNGLFGVLIICFSSEDFASFLRLSKFSSIGWRIQTAKICSICNCLYGRIFLKVLS